MPLKDNGNIVLGLGHITLYAAYMEEVVDAYAQIMACDWAGMPGGGAAKLAWQAMSVRGQGAM